jgi:hypothetical protein
MLRLLTYGEAHDTHKRLFKLCLYDKRLTLYGVIDMS